MTVVVAANEATNCGPTGSDWAPSLAVSGNLSSLLSAHCWCVGGLGANLKPVGAQPAQTLPVPSIIAKTTLGSVKVTCVRS